MKLEEYSKYYIQGSDHYLIPKDIFVELYKEMLNFRKETFELKRQLKYLRSGEYYNQLRFENEMLQNVVDTNGIPSEVYDYIECTHRNTELLEENQKLKNNWAKLKKWLKLHINTTTKDKTRILFKSILANVKEIEKSDNNG